MKILVHVLLSGLAVYAAAGVLPGVTVDGFTAAIVTAAALGLANAVLRPILIFLTLPINLLTLGLFTFVITGGLVELAASLVPGFHVVNFWWAMAFAPVLWLVNSFLHSFERD
jgi:putative membrane protein